MQVNKVILCGNITADPEIRYTNSGTPVAAFSIATNRQWVDSNGEIHEEADFHRIKCFERTAEIAGDYLRKGQLVYVEGRLRYSTYMKGEQKHFSTEIIVNHLQLGPKSRSDQSDDGAALEAGVPIAVPLEEEPPPITAEDEIPFLGARCLGKRRAPARAVPRGGGFYTTCTSTISN